MSGRDRRTSIYFAGGEHGIVEVLGDCGIRRSLARFDCAVPAP